MLINYKNEMMHDSTKRTFRQPFGAVPEGANVTLRFRTRIGVDSVFVSLFSEDFRHDYRMSLEGAYWQVSFDAPQPNVYWYYFTVNMGDKMCYYGAEGNKTGGIGCVYTEQPPSYQLTVYQKDFSVPSWFQKTVMYQIFPDRFRRSDDSTAKDGISYHKAKGRKVYYHKDWLSEPLYLPQKGEEHYDPCDYFGGTLKGIEDALDYIKALGIGVIYLNPVFEAASNHRYNTADYLKIDPVLGTNEDFASLCRKARKLGIRIMLDGVFSHTGSDSVYFNREETYEGAGAVNSQDSPYYPWYTFEHFPDKYKCWWGFESLPEVNEQNEDWQRFIITDQDSVVRHWIGEGACGYRLDVADELPDNVLALIHNAARETDNEAVILGEVWEDATKKYSYGQLRRYALGGMLDSVMNYPLRNAIVAFMLGSLDARQLSGFLLEQAENYPKSMYYSLMNLLSSHDIERIRTALGTRIDPHGLSREQQAAFYVSDSQNKKGARRQLLAAALQMALPGVPCVYYGDERGMNGLLDPFNRATFRECPYDLTEQYKKLIALRNQTDVMATGHAVFFSPDEDCIGILRCVVGRTDALGQAADDGICLVMINRSQKAKHFVIDFFEAEDRLPGSVFDLMRPKLSGEAVCQLTAKKYVLKDALLEMTLDAGGAAWIKIGDMN